MQSQEEGAGRVRRSHGAKEASQGGPEGRPGGAAGPRTRGAEATKAQKNAFGAPTLPTTLPALGP